MSDTVVLSPTNAHLTLLLKHARSTTVISVLPDTPLITLKCHLLQILIERNIKTFPGTNTRLPSKPEDIELGVLLDRHEPEKGWVFAEDRSNLDVVATTAKTISKKKSSSSSRGTVETVGDLELKDGGWIAYRLRGAHSRKLEDNEDEDEEETELAADPGWNVELPSFEDDDGPSLGQFGAADGGGDGSDGEGHYDEDENDDDDEEMDIPIPKPRNQVSR